MSLKEKTIGVLLGGLSEERPVSLKSGEAMAAALERRGYAVKRIDVGRDLPAVLVREGIEIAVLALHGPYGEDGTVQGLLEIMGIPYTGSGVTASGVVMDKGLCKRLFRDANIPTPPFMQLQMKPEEADNAAQSVSDDLLPAFVKPLRSGSSVGISRAENRAELVHSLAEAAKVSPSVMVEREQKGAEVTLTVIDGETYPLIEICPKEGFYDHTNKYTPGKTDYLIPPPSLDEAAMTQATETGLAAYRAAGCEGLARVDLIVEGETPWVLEINTIPGMTELSLAPQSAKSAGMSFEDLMERILATAGVDKCGGVS